ncbi:MAG: hypothetical protein K2W96_06280 [Gemmataceae bacterium]|nr:hypothetical protein [Gemmataceae bacterium]
MNCASCQASNPDNAAACAACGEPMPRRKPRRRPEAEEVPLTPEQEAFFRDARQAYWWALLSLLPPLGVVLGPMALAWATLSRRRAGAPDWVGMATLKLAQAIAALSFLTQAAGSALIAWSLWPGG